MRRATCASWMIGCLAIALASPASAWQGSESALKDRVSQLVERLESPKVETRAAAEKSLIDLGPRALPLIPLAGDAKKPDLAERIERVRAKLQEMDEQTNLGASKVTLQGQGIRLTEAIKALQTQTGNVVEDLREAFGEEATNPALDLDIQDKPFFEALDIVAEKAGVAINPYTGDGTLGLTAGAMAGSTMPKSERPMVLYTGPFRIHFKQLGAIRDFAAGTGTATATLDVLWEPRLRPMLLSLKNEDLAIVDDQGKPIPPQVSQETNETGLRAGNCAVEVNLNLTAPERSAKKISSLKVKGAVTVPSGMRTFQFPSLAGTNVTQKQGDVSVTLESTEVQEQVWIVALSVAFPGDGPAFESYRQGLFNNRTWLQKPDGSRFEQNGGFNSSGSSGGKMGFEYMFVDAPGKPADHMLVYETPAKVVTIPLEFEFKDVPLP
ncbi:hypothetical protein P12x_004957 [Tundrisphaera lichenicola]|uniref:hypothetical protein n=1 Tax=Tundrisphaera lichenicola TaxID=2029860 RepID=UPI003EBEF6D8